MEEGWRAMKWVCSKDIKQILKMAILSPSAHNSQPWKFKVSGDRVSVYLELSRMLSASDKHQRQAFESVGCAIYALFVVAGAHGHNLDIISNASA